MRGSEGSTSGRWQGRKAHSASSSEGGGGGEGEVLGGREGEEGWVGEGGEG